MTKKEIEKLLKQAGFKKRVGGKHDIWIKNGFPPIPVPGIKETFQLARQKIY